jgi:hypothetical protein
MKKSILYIFTIVFILASCKSSSKLVEQGNYDKAIEKSIKQILKGKADSEDIDMLDRAYNLANTQNQERIRLLKSEGKPENWEQIYFQYSALNNRQKQVRKVLPINSKGRTINYPQIDYTNDIVEAKTKAAEYYFNNGKRLMEQKNKFSYRDAYNNFSKAYKYRASAFPDIENLLADSKYLGTSRVGVDAVNSTRFRLPGDFFDKLLSFNTNNLSSNWVEYHIGRGNREVEFDYLITIRLQNINISPERFDQKEILRTKTVEDGFSYALDAKGNVMKDTLGNDIKIPKYKDLKCTLVERHQSKEVTVEAQIEYLELYPDRRVTKLIPITATSKFSNVSGKAVGDLDALLPEDRKLIERRSVAFPNDEDMIYDCTEPLQKVISDELQANKRLIK